MDKRDLTADIIKVCAVITAMPRWVGALLAAEGIIIPDDWRGWWIIASAIFNAAMAVTEGLAFAYVFNAWRNQRDKSADKLLWLAIASGAVFVVVLAPFIAAQVRGATLALLLSNEAMLWAWSASVAASTIIIVASVGYAQKRTISTVSKQPAKESIVEQPLKPLELAQEQSIATLELAQSVYLCESCNRSFATIQARSAHKAHCKNGHNPPTYVPILNAE